MIYLLPIGLVALTLTVIPVKKMTDYSASAAWIIPAMGFGLVTLATILIPVITFSSRAVGSTSCRHWGEQVSVPTKFIILNWADTGTCLAKTPGGRWVVNSNWQAFVNASK